MRKLLSRRAAGILTAMSLGVVGVIGVPTAAWAEPVCVYVPLNNENGDPIGHVCVTLDENSSGRPRVHGSVFVDETILVTVTVNPEFRPGTWVRVCVSTGPVAPDICILPE